MMITLGQRRSLNNCYNDNEDPAENDAANDHNDVDNFFDFVYSVYREWCWKWNSIRSYCSDADNKGDDIDEQDADNEGCICWADD
jgi:hypothetical protein